MLLTPHARLIPKSTPHGSPKFNGLLALTVRPPDQLELEVAEAKPYPTLQARLREKYAGRTLTFLELLNDEYPDGVWLEPEYRAALVAMEASEPRQVSVVRNRVTDSGKPATRGIQWPDALSFPA